MTTLTARLLHPPRWATDWSVCVEIPQVDAFAALLVAAGLLADRTDTTLAMGKDQRPALLFEQRTTTPPDPTVLRTVWMLQLREVASGRALPPEPARLETGDTDRLVALLSAAHLGGSYCRFLHSLEYLNVSFSPIGGPAELLLVRPTADQAPEPTPLTVVFDDELSHSAHHRRTLAVFGQPAADALLSKREHLFETSRIEAGHPPTA